MSFIEGISSVKEIISVCPANAERRAELVMPGSLWMRTSLVPARSFSASRLNISGMGCNFPDPVWKRRVKLFAGNGFSLLSHAGKHNLRTVDQGDIITNLFNRRHVVRGKNDRVSSILQFENFFFQQFGIHRVESAERFVEDQKFRFVDDGDDKCIFCCIPLDSSSSFLFHQGMISNFSNQRINLVRASW